MTDSLVAYLAGVLSTFPPYDLEHPELCIPMAEAVVKALEDWLPDDDQKIET